MKAPAVTGWYQAGGRDSPISRALPESEETGTSRPEKLTAGMMDRSAVAKTAATWVFMKVEMNCPKPVVAAT
ncbi:hypothetical protein CHKEEEPN_4244 [Methylorubrum podarium]|nr:hypothetical protein CHKEEEPN_4244 [Methylorubrum podarium]